MQPLRENGKTIVAAVRTLIDSKIDRTSRPPFLLQRYYSFIPPPATPRSIHHLFCLPLLHLENPTTTINNNNNNQQQEQQPTTTNNNNKTSCRWRQTRSKCTYTYLENSMHSSLPGKSQTEHESVRKRDGDKILLKNSHRNSPKRCAST